MPGVVTVAVCIVAGLLGALALLVAERLGAPAWVCFWAGFTVGAIALAAGPAVLGG